MDAKTFSEMLKHERKRLGITQGEASRLCAVHLRTFAGWEAATNKRLQQVLMEGALARLSKASAIDAKCAIV